MTYYDICLKLYDYPTAISYFFYIATAGTNRGMGVV